MHMPFAVILTREIFSIGINYLAKKCINKLIGLQNLFSKIATNSSAIFRWDENLPRKKPIIILFKLNIHYS
jgi:hypothetical protein